MSNKSFLPRYRPGYPLGVQIAPFVVGIVTTLSTENSAGKSSPLEEKRFSPEL